VTSLQRPHAVIVDDEQSYLDLLAAILGEHLECPVRTFARPQDALAAVPGMEIGIIVTDFYMPEIDGLEFLRQVEAIKPGIPSIIITGHGEALQGRSFKSIPALKEILAKPFGASVLAEAIRKYWQEADELA
jgi:two-component system response regulator FixJ